nr:calcium-binding protein [uncultured Shinella sp.]
MANFYIASAGDMFLEDLTPSKFSQHGSVNTTPSEIKFYDYDGDGFTGYNIYSIFRGVFTYDTSGSKITDIHGTVNSFSYSYSGHDSAGTYSSSGWSVSNIDIDVDTFKTKQSWEILDLMMAGDDIVNGSSTSNVLRGGAGNDVIYGNGGGDSIYGGQGADIMVGGAGNTIYHVDNPYDAVVEFSGGGNDTVFSSLDYALGQFVDNLVLEDSTIRGSGNELKNKITGNSNNNTLSGGGGNDTLKGEAGDDRLIGGAGADFLQGGAGADAADYSTSQSGLSVSLYTTANGNTGDARGDTFMSVENLIGSKYNDVLQGGSNDNDLAGGAGHDKLKGRQGDDSLHGEAGNDLLIGDGGADRLDGGAGTDTVSYADGGAVIASLANAAINTGDAKGDTYFSIENIIGSYGNDYIFGNSGNNTIDGGNGNDILKGYDGNDRLIGSGGDDVFVFNTKLNVTSNIDTIQDFNVVDDAIWLDNSVFKALRDGALSSGAFRIGSAAADASDRIIYDDKTGKLSYDIDGAGGAGATQFALLSKNLTLTAADFIII